MSSTITDPDPPLRHAGALEVHLLGTVDFDAFLGLQEYLTYEISGRDDTSGMLLLCEHPPLITIGRQGSSADLPVDSGDLERDGINVRWISRSGGAFPHGPGQLAAYLMIPLNRLGIGLSQYKNLLEFALCETCRELKIPVKRSAAAPGLWGRGGQIAFFGASVRSWISNHGMFLNVTISPELLKLTKPNSVGGPPSSIQSQRLQPVSMTQIRESVSRQIADKFGYEMTDISTGHPLLKRTLQKVPTYV